MSFTTGSARVAQVRLVQQVRRVQPELQAQLVKQSTDAKLEVAEMSGHGIPLEQPGIIVDAIKEPVAKWRAHH
jgi:pimeloyl-ACP methyl ester carboxylesterase